MVNSIKRKNLPDTDRLSILAAMIVLSYTLERFIDLPTLDVSKQLPGLYVEFSFSVNLVISLLAAVMTTAGANWLMRSHPASHGRLALQHAILPALTALVIGISLERIPLGVTWWIGLIGGASVMVLVIIAEYIAVDPEDSRLPLASAALSAVSFALFLLFAGELKASAARVLFITPALFLAAWLVSLRVINLRLHGEWTVYESAIVALIIGQLSAALNYWPLQPFTYALLLLGPTYALISIFCNLIEKKSRQQLFVELIVSMVLALGAALLIR